MTDEDLSYKGNNPGAVKYGNFINYYSFHSPRNRLDNLSASMFPATDDESCVCLDIGCNTGMLTRELHLYLSTIFPMKQVYILGVDIDKVLIQRAVECNKTENVTFKNMDIMKQNEGNVLKAFLETHNKTVFDIVFCFSVTMWIHLNHGDEGLETFLKIVTSSTNTLILEPQPWRCYKTAYRRMKRSNDDFPLFKMINIRENVEDIIEQLIVCRDFVKVAESSHSSWNRKVQSYRCIN